MWRLTEEQLGSGSILERELPEIQHNLVEALSYFSAIKKESNSMLVLADKSTPNNGDNHSRRIKAENGCEVL